MARVEGVPQLVAALNRVRANFDRGQVEPVVMDACQPTAAAMAEGCPVRTGNTKRGIQARLLEDKSAVVVGIGPHRDHFWARGLEFGTATRPALGFLRSGFDGDEGALKERLRRGLGQLVTEGARA